MDIKKYRVICWQPSTSGIDDEIFVDIAPESGVAHNMMFYSRLKLFRGNDVHKNIVSRAGSVYLNVTEDATEPEIIFSQQTDVPQERLIPLILSTYKIMRAEEKETTLPIILSAWETEKIADEFLPESSKRDADIFERKQRERRAMFVQKHVPQTPQEERMYQSEEEFFRAVSRKKIAIEEQANRDAMQDPITRMREKMRQYSGD